MAKKDSCPKKKVPAKKPVKGLADAAEKGGLPIRVAVERMSIQPPLRDMFAAFALAGMLANEGYNHWVSGRVAEEAWMMADQMLETRGK